MIREKKIEIKLTTEYCFTLNVEVAFNDVRRG